ncbi:ttc31 [Pungitius sinensis]
MPKKRDPVKGGAPMARIREDSRLMRTHESMVDFIHGRPATGNILDLFTSGLLGLDFLRTLEGELEDDIVYSDDDDDGDDDHHHHHHHHLNAHDAAYKNLKPHPRIKQLTNEEADKHAKDLMEEEERRKDKTVKNKRKKLRKKEKKRLEKGNTVKDILPEEEKEKSHSDNLMENPVIESKTEAKDSPESGTQAASCDEKSSNNKEENLKEINKTEDQQQKQNFDLNNSSASTTKPVAEETRSERPAADRKKKKTKLLDVSPSEEEKPKVVKKLKEKKKKTMKMKEEEKHDPNEESSIDPAAEESAQRSRELAAFGNRLASLGQYETAVQCFTDAIKYNPQESKLFGNRSLCYERLQRYDEALRDADQALSMEPNWIKGLFRKGKALCGLKRYYEASLIYREVLKLEASSGEASQELKRAQTLHLMEMGFSWTQSSEALKRHATLEQAVEALFGEESNPGRGEVGACRAKADAAAAAEEDDSDGGEWIHLRTSRPRMQQVKVSDAQSRSNSQSPTPRSGNPVKLEIFSVWVGSLSPAITYSTLHELFSRAGTVHSIKMLLEQQCVFVNYTSVEDCDRAIQCFNGMVVEGSPLSVRYPNKFRLAMSSAATSDPFPRLNLYKKECFFWRTVGCTRLGLHLPTRPGAQAR